jgi:peptide-methionine (S)-S-oxide reductase
METTLYDYSVTLNNGKNTSAVFRFLKKELPGFPLLLLLLLLPMLLYGSHKFNNTETMKDNNKTYQTATFGGGCFWCIEAIYTQINGVISATSGYSGGKIKNPTYREVSSGLTGHAEVVQIVFDPEVITYHDVLTIFFHVHDPTTLNRQGADVGTQYRSVIYYHDEHQKALAELVMQETADAKLWNDALVTELSPLGEFYRAEDYHQNYFENNPNASYCTFVISPKMEKFRKNFKEYLK